MEELTVITEEQAGTIALTNFETLKAALAANLEKYRNTEYTEGALDLVKQDKKALRSLKKALDDRRKEIKNMWMEPYQQFEAQIKELMAMIPGVGKAVKDLDIDDNAFKGVEAIIRSMTPKERANPDIINNSRKERIARGSGTTLQEVNRLMKQFEQIRKTMKGVAGGKLGNMMGGMPKFKR